MIQAGLTAVGRAGTLRRKQVVTWVSCLDGGRFQEVSRREAILRQLKFYVLSLLLFAFLSSLLFLVTELLIRWYYLGDQEGRYDVEETSYMPTRLKSNYQGELLGVPFSTNQYGFRDEENFSKVPPPGEFRILSLGDSVGFGLAIEAADHYSKVAQRRLNGLDPSRRYHLVNAGGQGYSPSSYYVYLREEGMQVEPGMVIVEIELCNDIPDEALLSWRGQSGDGFPNSIVGGRYLVSWDGNLLGTYSRGSYFFEKTYTYTIFVRRLLNLLYRIYPTEPFHSVPGSTVYYTLGFDRFVLNEARIEAGWQRLFGALGAIHQLLREQQIPFLLMILPSSYIYENGGDQRRLASGLLEKAVSMAKEKRLPYLALKEAIEEGGGARLFLDFVHLTEEGNRVVGEALSEQLLQMIGSPFAGDSTGNDPL